MTEPIPMEAVGKSIDRVEVGRLQSNWIDMTLSLSRVLNTPICVASLQILFAKLCRLPSHKRIFKFPKSVHPKVLKII